MALICNSGSETWIWLFLFKLAMTFVILKSNKLKNDIKCNHSHWNATKTFSITGNAELLLVNLNWFVPGQSLGMLVRVISL